MGPQTYQGLAVGFVLGYLTYHLCKRLRQPLIKGGLNCKFVMVVRTDINLEKGKTAEVCSQAALECYRQAMKKTPEYVWKWEKNGQPKIAVKLEENADANVLILQKKAENLGLISAPVKYTHKTKEVYMVLGVGPGPQELIDQVTGHLKLL